MRVSSDDSRFGIWDPTSFHIDPHILLRICIYGGSSLGEQPALIRACGTVELVTRSSCGDVLFAGSPPASGRLCGVALGGRGGGLSTQAPLPIS